MANRQMSASRRCGLMSYRTPGQKNLKLAGRTLNDSTGDRGTNVANNRWRRSHSSSSSRELPAVELPVVAGGATMPLGGDLRLT
ncbi:hypothetical protein Dda_1700 [Drechslerella dactyloides]|uniref:Uncharacterized protein n=1 Tax=Drechslerella dactyloides TaxID=74499 RepID=A0AAD6NMC6_DREDA|nr:hypothetical protein Dda_1700 [Drechslerella dactyloides]